MNAIELDRQKHRADLGAVQERQAGRVAPTRRRRFALTSCSALTGDGSKLASLRGLTLPELLIVTVFVGLLAMIAAPQFQTVKRQQELNQAVAEVEGALKEAQRQAARDGVTCRVAIADNSVETQCPLGTIVRQTPIDEGVQLTTTFADDTVDFTFRGTTSDVGTVTLGLDGGTFTELCVVVASLMGRVRSGRVDNTNCVTR